MISQKDYKDIWNYFIEKLKKKKFNIDLKIEDIFLSFDIIDDLSYNLTNLLTQEKNFFKINNSNEYNNKYIGIIIYTMRICFHSFTIDNGFEKYFYSKLLNPNANLIELINNNYVPGFNRGKKGIEKIKLQDLINNNNYKIKINKNENEIQINPLTILILRFLFYSHLLFATLLQKVDIKNIINCFSTSENYSLLKIIIELWEKINELIPGKENNKIEILLNRINKDIVKIYNQCQNLEEENDRNIFENNFNNYMNECFEDYEYFKLIYFDNTMKAIIQEDNYPLSYNKIEYPYIKYFVVSHYPKMDDLQIKRDEYITKNEWDLCMIDSIFKEKEYKDDINYLIQRKMIQIYIKFFSLNPFIDKNSFSFNSELFNDNSDFLFKCKKFLDDNIFKDIENKKEIANQDKIESSIKVQNSFLTDILEDIKKKNEYLFKNMRRKININSFFEEQAINLKYDKISNYSSDIELLSKYIYKDVFSPESKEVSQYVAIKKIIEYKNYQKYSIDLNSLENELISIILPNKRMFEENSDDFISHLKLLEGNRVNIIYNFINIYPNYVEKLDNNFEEIILNSIESKDILNIFIENSIIGLFKYSKYNNINIKSLEIKNILYKYYENKKKSLLELIKTGKIELENDIIIESKRYFIIYVYFSLQKIIIYLTENIITEDLPLYEILNNSPEILNISNYAISFFQKHQEFTLKHLFSIYELFEKLLFFYIKNNIHMDYKQEITKDYYDEILYYFEENKEIEETIFSFDQLKEALRKYISRYIITNDIPVDSYLFDEINKRDLWSKDIYNKLFYGIHYFKKYKILSTQALSLYELLSFKPAEGEDPNNIFKNIDTPEKKFYSKYYKILEFHNLVNYNIKLLSTIKDI